MSAQKEDYLYLSSLLRAREKNMLTHDRAERMLDAPGFEDCAKLLTDSGYEDMSQMNIKQIEDALAARRAALFRELEGLVPDPAALDLFRMKYDYHNIKVLIKSAAMEQEDSALLSESGRIPRETLLRCFRDDRLRDLPGAIGAAAEEARNLLSRSANPQLSDFLLDKAYFAELQEKAEALVPGGSISEERLISGIAGEGIASVFAGSALAKAAQLGADAVSGGTLTGFELACDNALNAYLADAKRASFGEECVLAYIAGQESELTAVRMILTGRLAGVPSDTIRERLRDLYE